MTVSTPNIDTSIKGGFGKMGLLTGLLDDVLLLLLEDMYIPFFAVFCITDMQCLCLLG